MNIRSYIESELGKKKDLVIEEEKSKQFEISIQNCKNMDSKRKQAIIDEITVKQPCLMHEITELKKLGVSEDKYQYIIDLLIILYGYFSGGGKTELPVITEKIIKEVKENLDAFIEWQHNESPEENELLLVKLFLSHPEMYALGYVTRYILDLGFNTEMPDNVKCFKIGRVILDCFIKIKKEKSA